MTPGAWQFFLHEWILAYFSRTLQSLTVTHFLSALSLSHEPLVIILMCLSPVCIYLSLPHPFLSLFLSAYRYYHMVVSVYPHNTCDSASCDHLKYKQNILESPQLSGVTKQAFHHLHPRTLLNVNHSDSTVQHFNNKKGCVTVSCRSIWAWTPVIQTHTILK